MLLDANGNPLSSDKVSLRQLSFKELPKRLKVLFIALSAGIAAVAVLLTNLQSIIAFFSTPSAELVLEDTTVSDDGYAPRIEMFVRNSGDAKAIITRARIEVLDEIRWADFFVAPAPMNVEVPYDVTVLLGDRDNTSVAVDDFAREIDPSDADRIRFNIATTDSGSQFLVAYTLRIVLTYNDSTEIESSPVWIAAASPFMFEFFEVPEAVRRQAPPTLTRLSKTDAEKGAALMNLERKLRQIVNSEE